MRAIRRYRVKSASRPGKQHELVVINELVSSCSCEAFSFGKRCHHARDMSRFIEEFTEVEAGTPDKPVVSTVGPRFIR